MANENKELTLVQKISREMTAELADPATQRALLETTFKGLDVVNMKKAIMEGMIRGFTFKDFLQKNVYAIPFAKGYSLVTSIDDARKRGMKSGIVGKLPPVYETDGDKIISCTVTVKRMVGGYVGDYSATVFFSEFYKAGRNGYPSLWDTKPRVMIAKVAEMHALRMACPEELSQIYTEEELEAENKSASQMHKAQDMVESSNLKMKNLKKDEEKIEEEITVVAESDPASQGEGEDGLPA